MSEGRATSAGLRTLCGALLALSLLALPACSYSTDFVVVNDSGSPVEVRYTLKSRYRRDECCTVRPAKKAFDKLDDGDTPWRDVPAGEFSHDRAAGAVTLTLYPGEALRVAKGSNWRGHGDSSGDEFFEIESISIAGAGGGVHYEGRQAQYQFQQQDSQLYKLTYYGWGDKAYDGGR
ncbi:MAG: hypothetical protein LC795_22170 [Acidobacteria bacterium]|nr:hypothetical protein [Acidobacteriota bacterium]